jgi:alkanesulfonate monooxygenase SsuD/methylene tetrahydromethanopterin reductase-like flavin-dependent oxidoreductase (luciferase family)
VVRHEKGQLPLVWVLDALASIAEALGSRSIDQAIAVEELGADGAYFRVHHFAREQAATFPILAAAPIRNRQPFKLFICADIVDLS